MPPIRILPPLSSDDTPRKKRRRRQPKACDTCRQRKIKCDLAEPRCDWCQHQNIPCTFANQHDPATSRDPSTRTPHNSSARANESSPQTQNTGTLNTITNQTVATAAQQRFFGKLHFAGRDLGHISSYNGIPFFSHEGQQWIKSLTGQISIFEKTNNATTWPPSHYRNPKTDCLCQSLFQTQPPDVSIVEEYLNAYELSCTRLVYPTIHSTLFRSTINSAYQSTQTEHVGYASATACIFSFLAFASICSVHKGSAPFVDSKAYALRVHAMIPRVLQEGPSLDGLQAFVMLGIFEFASGNMPSAAYLASLKAHYIFMLGAHTQPGSLAQAETVDDDIPSLIQNHLRNIFWLCYTIDKDLSLKTGQPSLLHDEHCDLTLPPGYLDQLHTCDTFPYLPNDLPPVPYFPVDLRLSMIKSRAYSALYSMRGLQKDDTELSQDIRQLDDDLERWRQSIPPEWRPTLSFLHDTPVDAGMGMRSVMLRLDYHHCMAAIHQASSRCRAWAYGHSGIIEGVSSSLVLSVQASRSTLFYLQAAEYALVDEIFWVIISYPVSALLTVFCNILQNPFCPQAKKDHQLSSTMPLMVQKLFRQHSPSNEAMHLKHIVDFVAELNRLAKCAIDKAIRDRLDGSNSLLTPAF
ncbi:hypothetical protein AWENTII_006661 [Aspergillus wentii]